MHRTLRATALALVFVLAAASARALTLSARPGALAEPSLIARVWTWVGSWLPRGLTPVWENGGSDMDPNGQPQNNSASADSTEEGSSMDPNERP